MADMKKVYNDLTSINLHKFETKSGALNFFYQVPRIENEQTFLLIYRIFGIKLYAPARLKQY
jgi:hypothetical protein